MSFRFLHCADLHLDSPLRGLSRYDGAPADEIRGATRHALENLVQLAIDREVAFVLIAGDVYDGDWKDHNTGLFFRLQMARLGRSGIRAFIVSGNHDAASRISRALELPDNVRVFPTDRPATEVLDDLGVAVHGQGFAHREITTDLAAQYPEADRGLFNIGLLHTSADGREGHEPYAPTSVETLVRRGYDYWALGHIHQREVLCEEPWIVFSGCVQGRSIRETGAKGCTLVSVENGAVGSVEHHSTDVWRWALCEVDARDAESPDAVLERFERALTRELDRAEGRQLATRVRIHGACAAHDAFVAEPRRWTGEIRGRATEISAERAWVEKVRIDTSTIREQRESTEVHAAIGGLLRGIETLRADDDALVELATSALADLVQKLPTELAEGADRLEVDRPDALRAVLDDVHELLLPRLIRTEDTP